jgi:hypothetical protein
LQVIAPTATFPFLSEQWFQMPSRSLLTVAHPCGIFTRFPFHSSADEHLERGVTNNTRGPAAGNTFWKLIYNPLQAQISGSAQMRSIFVRCGVLLLALASVPVPGCTSAAPTVETPEAKLHDPLN